MVGPEPVQSLHLARRTDPTQQTRALRIHHAVRYSDRDPAIDEVLLAIDLHSTHRQARVGAGGELSDLLLTRSHPRSVSPGGAVDQTLAAALGKVLDADGGATRRTVLCTLSSSFLGRFDRCSSPARG
jgi:hypothetical protein